MTQSDEIQLLTLCAQGDRVAFEKVVERYQNLICSMAYSAFGNHARSEDLAQEIFIAAWRQLRSLRDQSRFKAWLCGIARNLIKQSIRKESRNPVTSAVSLEEARNTAGKEPCPAEEAIRAEEESLVWQSLEKIPETYREPLVLFYREDQSIRRVAEALDLTQDTVKQRLSRGREMLRQEVSNLVESTLTKSKPTGPFTAGVLAALPFATPNSATAVGAAGSGAKAAGSMLKGLSLIPLIKLLVIGWGVKAGLDSTRSPSEMRFYIAVLLGGAGVLTLYCIALFAPEWIGLENFLTGSPSRPAILMAITISPFILVLYFSGQHLRKIRMEEGHCVEDQPVLGETTDSLSRSGVMAQFALGTFGVAASPGAFAIFMREWTDLAIIALTACLAWAIGTMLCLRHPKRHLLVMGISACATGGIALLATWLGRASPTHSAASAAASGDWFPAALGGTTLTIAIINLLAWKRSELMQRNRDDSDPT